MIGTLVHPRSAWITSMPSERGMPRSSMMRSGWGLRGGGDRGGAVGGHHHLVSVRGQGDPQGSNHLRVVVGDEELHSDALRVAGPAASGRK